MITGESIPVDKKEGDFVIGGAINKTGSFLMKAKKVGAIVFDKTGTLTKGKSEVTEVVAIKNLSEKEILRLAASLEIHSEHPIGKAIVLSKKTLQTVYLNLFWAFIYNIILIPVAMMGKINPFLASGAMAFSSVSVVGNVLLLKLRKI